MNEFLFNVKDTAISGGLIALIISFISVVICYKSIKIISVIKKYLSAPLWLEDKILSLIKNGEDKQKIIEICSRKSPFFSNMIKYILNNANPNNINNIMDEIYVSEFPYFKNNIEYLKAFVNCAPLLGLLGTVWGMIHTFSVLALNMGYSTKLISQGISQALITTQFGLIAALPGIFAASVLWAKTRQLEIRFRNFEINIKSGMRDYYEKIK